MMKATNSDRPGMTHEEIEAFEAWGTDDLNGIWPSTYEMWSDDAVHKYCDAFRAGLEFSRITALNKKSD